MSPVIKYLNLFELYIDEALPSYAKANLFAAYNIKNYCPETISSGLKFHLSPISNNKNDNGKYVKVGPFSFANTYSIIEKNSYKLARWRSELEWSSDLKTVSLKIKGNFFSQWVWPYQTFNALKHLFLPFQGGVLLHAAGFANYSNGAAVVFAPSGTGKTLTALNWLCRGRQIFHDNTVIWHKGNIIPSSKSIMLYYNRYQNQGNLLPGNMPKITAPDKIKMYRNELIEKITFNLVGLGTPLEIDKYWPKSISSPKPLQRLIVLNPGERFKLSPKISKQKIICKIMEETRSQNTSISRWLSNLGIVSPKSKLLEWEDVCAGKLNTMLQDVEIVCVGVPEMYSQKVYKNIEKLITE